MEFNIILIFGSIIVLIVFIILLIRYLVIKGKIKHPLFPYRYLSLEELSDIAATLDYNYDDRTIPLVDELRRRGIGFEEVSTWLRSYSRISIDRRFGNFKKIDGALTIMQAFYLYRAWYSQYASVERYWNEFEFHGHFWSHFCTLLSIDLNHWSMLKGNPLAPNCVMIVTDMIEQFLEDRFIQNKQLMSHIVPIIVDARVVSKYESMIENNSLNKDLTSIRNKMKWMIDDCKQYSKNYTEDMYLKKLLTSIDVYYQQRIEAKKKFVKYTDALVADKLANSIYINDVASLSYWDLIPLLLKKEASDIEKLLSETSLFIYVQADGDKLTFRKSSITSLILFYEIMLEKNQENILTKHILSSFNQILEMMRATKSQTESGFKTLFTYFSSVMEEQAPLLKKHFKKDVDNLK